MGDCYGMDDKKEAERVAKEYISEKKIEALNIQNVSGRFYSDTEIATLKEECYQDGIEEGEMNV